MFLKDFMFFKSHVEADINLSQIFYIIVLYEGSYQVFGYGFKNNFEYYDVDIITDWYFKFEDVDSLENGLYENRDTVITLNPGFLHNNNGEWYTGRIESDIVITMEAKN